MNAVLRFATGKAVRNILATVAVFALGMLTGVFVHYTLHRLILSPEPFIYVIF